MSKIWRNIANFFTKITFRDVIYWFVILCMAILLSTAVSKCQSVKREYKNNIVALTDSIHYLQDKNGNLVATKRAFESDIKTLKVLNKALYDEIDDLKLKNSISNIVYVSGEIENPTVDTAYIVMHDTIDKGFHKEFNFNDEYYELAGHVDYGNDSLNVGVDKNTMYFDYSVAMDKDNQIYIKSTNPYVKYNEISGFTVPKTKQKRWYVGPSVNVGYGVGLHDGKVIGTPNISVGISAGYGLFRF